MQNKFHITMLAISIIFFALAASAVWYMYGMTEKKYLAIEEAHASWKAEEDRRAQVKQLERMLEDLDAEQIELESHFARSLDVVPLLDTLEKIGLGAGANAEVSSVDRIEDGKFISVGIKATGSWSALYKFTVLLENSPYELEFSTLDIKRAFAEAEGGGVIWEGFFKVKVLSFLP